MLDNQRLYLDAFDSSGADGVRWMDQKVTYDVLAEIARTVSAYVKNNLQLWFTRKDLQRSASLDHTLQREYGKPSLSEATAANEYDKLIGQSLNTLAYAGVLRSERRGNTRFFQLSNADILNRIAGNEKEARIFLITYLEWVLRKFGWWGQVERYIYSEHTDDDLQSLKADFTKLLIDTMSLGSRGSKNPEVEAGRIFAKVINPIAYSELVPGIERGRISKTIPSTFELIYNKPNWFDARSNKPRNMTRKQYNQQLELTVKLKAPASRLTAAKRKVRDYHNFVAEVPDASGTRATHIHHIFPAHLFPELDDIYENLIALTPGQHLGEAHPHGNTSRIDPVYQRTCLIHKLYSVKRSEMKGDGMYSYDNFARVLEKGWSLEGLTPAFDSLREVIASHLA